MKCDLCDKPACVHEVTLKSGVKKEVHLCEEHARESGIQIPTHQPINQLLTQFVVAHSAKQQQRVIAKPCPQCGLTFAQFKQTGRVGCPECYTAFDEQLSPLIERTQNGGTHHVGKSPKRAGISIDRQVMIQRLVKEIETAVSAEQYERAASLRDKLLKLKTDVTGASTEGTKEVHGNG